MHSNHHHGWYSNRAKGERKKRGMLRPGDEPEEERSDDVTVLDVSDYNPPRLASKTWRQPTCRGVGNESVRLPKRLLFAIHCGQVVRTRRPSRPRRFARVTKG
jgi:hypothetical protein